MAPRHLTRAVLTAAATLTLTACKPLAEPAGPGATPAAAAGTGVAVLDSLPVRVEDTGAHYNRADWGDWAGTGRSCTTRTTVLQRQGTAVTTGTGCKVTGGRWVSPYDGAVLTTAADVQIDHRVPIKEAVRSGARNWNRAQREKFYNDPANLIAASVRSNTSKGDRDPGKWKPTARASWCDYARGYITTKRAYGLSIDTAEHAGLRSMLAICR